MKFRGKMTEVVAIRQFTHLLSLVAKLAKTCNLRITEECLYFVISDWSTFGGTPHLWSQLDQGHYFTEYNFQGVTAEDNEIILELQPEILAKTLNSLKSAQSAKSLKIRLTKKHSAMLSFEIELASLLSENCRVVVHDIPVNIVPRRLWHLYKEPQMLSFQVSIYLPSLKLLRNVIERMKNFSSFVSLSANNSGEFFISVSVNAAEVTTHFRDLQMPHWDDKDQIVDKEEKFGATVDVKRLSSFLQSEHVQPTKVICNILNGEAIHLFLLHEDVTLQYFLPNVTPS